ncbi:MAG: DUF3365 domain-containing protein, partial [Desulfocapsa sp.]|nr:DUF3365 domain-containing protein [Desulfocapsa sp.]
MNIKRYFFVSAFFWSLLMLVAMGYEMRHTMEDSDKLALIEARTALAKDLIYRKWVVSKGGVYGLISKNTPPNPYLIVPEQNIETPSGNQLTLINPAYMIRQVYELEREENGIRSHITSLKPIRPENKADTWEEVVLRKFEQGVDEYSEKVEIDGEPYFRFMKALKVQQGCLKCHAIQGYKEGEVRGGISIATPMVAIMQIEKDKLIRSYFAYLFLWILGIGGLSYGSYHLQKQLNKRRETETELQKFKQTLDQTSDCVFMFSPETLRFFYLNQGAIDLMGYSEAELLEMTPIDIKPLFTEQSFREITDPLIKTPGKSISL